MCAAPAIFGIRHHGPGSARSLLRALEQLEPDLVLVEGPPDADELIELAAHAEMKPPVALLIYDPEAPRRAAFYPFAVFSPEWQAIQYAHARKIPLRFMDLPQAHRLAMQTAVAGLAEQTAESDEAGEDSGDGPPTAPPAPDPHSQLRRDPLLALASAAGFTDGERWWDQLVESRRGGHAAVFDAIADAMVALREHEPTPATAAAPTVGDRDSAEGVPHDRLEALREAWMRKTIRAAGKEHERIAVVCGAWHLPALRDCDARGLAAADNALLKGLAKVKTAAAWVPWSDDRLAADTGYGAGVASPEWYHLLWSDTRHVAIEWLTRAARLMRKQDLDVSSGHVIEAARLSETLAALRGRPLPGLEELDESARAVLCGGFDPPMQLVRRRLIVGERLGSVPESAPLIPLQTDLQRQQKTLRLQARIAETDYELDLRKPLDLDRSRLLHRLRLLEVPWGEHREAAGRTKGTFHENWRLQWDPEFVVRLVEAGRFGNTVADAAATKVAEAARQTTGLSQLTPMLEHALLADLPAAVGALIRTIQNQAAVAADVPLMMDALTPLARATRYGSVRRTDAELVLGVVRGLVERVCIGLGNACASLDDEAARAMFGRINAFHGAIVLLDLPDLTTDWLAALHRLADQQASSGIVTGRACRILHDRGLLDSEETGRRFSYGLSQGNDPPRAAAWIEGLLAGSGQLLIHDDGLWRIVERWVAELADDAFEQTLPLLRRTFATFAGPERRQMGARVKRGAAGGGSGAAVQAEADFDYEKASAVLPLLARIFGVERK